MSPVGRPRALPQDFVSDPRRDILAAAARLFASTGYTATSTRAIADAVGLRQGSLFHYYPRKEAILAELLEETLRPTLDLVELLEQAKFEPTATLWCLVERDVANLSKGPYNAGALQLLPEVRSPQFDWFWRRRESLFDYYRSTVHAGLSSGAFVSSSEEVAADLVFGLVESVITARESLRRDPTTPVAYADAALRLLGVSGTRIKEARRQAAVLEAMRAG